MPQESDVQHEVIPKPQAAAQESDFGPWLAKASILVVDDEPGMRNFLVRTLESRCKFIDEAADTVEASRKLDERHFDIVILDNIMPKKTGLEWLAEQRSIGLYAETILMTAYADLDTAIQAIRAGAADFVLKPFRSNQILNAISRALDRIQLQRENFALKYELRAASDHIYLRDRIFGSSATIQQTREMISRVAPLPTSVLLTGESGTGKEVLARSLHELSDRAGKPFVPLNCAAIPADMLETELFGHVKGAFTGADSRREGLFLHAQGGTLFLDEIGEMPVSLQSKLLRVIEDRKVRPVGSEREVPIDIRFVFATNADLAKDVEKGRFRADLYYRINVMQVHLAPLRERENDVLELTDLFMNKLSRQLGMPPVQVDDAIRTALLGYNWPGNVRELRNLIERTLILGRFPADLRGGISAPASNVTLEELERRHILSVLDEVAGNRDEAAKRLGISRKTIDRKLTSWHG